MDIGDTYEQRERAEQTGSAASTPVGESSPLSELPGTPQVNDDATIDGASTANGEDEAATGDDDDASEQSLNQVFRCEYCGKAYNNEKSLKGHLREKRSKCGKRRANAEAGATMFSCSRCHSQMAQRYSVDRHIKDSCWKICDECVKAGNPACNAYHSEGDCSRCMEHGRSCTKYMASIPECFVQVLAAASGTTRAATTPTVKREGGKRKATGSPDASTDPKHAVKRPITVIKQEDTTRPYVYRPQTSRNDAALERWMRNRQNFPMVDSNTQYQQPPYGSSTSVPPPGMAIVPQPSQHPQQSQGRYNDLGRAPPSTSQFYQMQSSQQGRGVAPQIAYPKNPGTSAYGIQPSRQPGPDYTPDAETQALMEQLHHQQQMLLQMANGTRPITGYLTPPIVHNPQPACNPVPMANPPRANFNDIHPPETRLNRFRPAQTGNFKIYEDAPGAHPQRLHPKDFIASAPGSRMPSRQSSADPVEDPRAPSRMPAFEQLRGMNRMPKTFAKKPVAQELTEPIAYHPSESLVVDENSPMLRLRIHSNTYDPQGTPIFSILTIRANQKFGPRLDAYCQQRDKQYGKDWVFVYQYALGRKGGGECEKYIKLTYDMTPEDVKDNEQPHITLRDMDSISVMKTKQYAAMDANKKNGVETPLSPIGSQVSEDEVDIVDGETRVYQNAGTISDWQRACENKLGEMQAYTVELKQYIARQKDKIAKQEATISDLETRNMNMTMAHLRAQAVGRAQHMRQQQRPATSANPPEIYFTAPNGNRYTREKFEQRLAQATPKQQAQYRRMAELQQPFVHQGRPFTGFSNPGGHSEAQVRAMVAAGYQANMARQAAAPNPAPYKMSEPHKVAHQEQVYQQMVSQYRQQELVRQQKEMTQFRFPAPNNHGVQERRPTYASGPQEPFPDFVDPDGLPLFHGQDNPPPEFQSPRYPGYAPAVPIVQPQSSFWDGFSAQNNVAHRYAPISEAGSKVKVSKEEEDSVMEDE